MDNRTVMIGVISIIIISLLSGCTDIGTVSISDIYKHPNDYIGKEITVKGNFVKDVPKTGYNIILQYVDDYPYNLLIKFSDDVNTSVLYEGGEYKFTGIIGVDDIASRTIYYMNVTKIAW